MTSYWQIGRTGSAEAMTFELRALAPLFVALTGKVHQLFSQGWLLATQLSLQLLSPYFPYDYFPLSSNRQPWNHGAIQMREDTTFGAAIGLGTE